MSIKSDRWIRKMAREHGLIEPFEDGQVREGVVSYGLSSYGYDLRVGPEFKVFTNVHSTIVDPKNFDQSSFVDIEGDCIIPPNSFALARTVEYLRIPRNVITVCLGKSTYARCFSGDTKVALVDGTSASLEDMARRSEDGELFWGYGVGQHGRVIVALLDAPRYVGRDSLLELTLDNGEVVRCTPDHEFLRRDGRLAAADDLRPGDSLMPLYRDLARGYEVVYQPLNGFLYPTHRLADEWNVRNGIYEDVEGTHRHHKDHDRRNNNPWNLERMPAAEHIRHHDAIDYGEDFDPDERSAAIRAAFERLSQDPEWREHRSYVQRERALRFWHDEAYAGARDRLRASHAAAWTEARRREAAKRLRQRHADPEREHARNMREAWARAPQRRERRRGTLPHRRGAAGSGASRRARGLVHAAAHRRRGRGQVDAQQVLVDPGPAPDRAGAQGLGVLHQHRAHAEDTAALERVLAAELDPPEIVVLDAAHVVPTGEGLVEEGVVGIDDVGVPQIVERALQQTAHGLHVVDDQDLRILVHVEPSLIHASV